MNIVLMHKISVWLFVLIYLSKSILLFTDSYKQLDSFSRFIKIPEMLISTIFLASGIYLFYQLGVIKSFQVYKLIAIFVSIPLAIVGFKNKKKITAFTSFFLILLAYGFAEMARTQSPIGARSTNEKGTVEGEVIYNTRCAYCHGLDGTKGYNGASNLKKTQMSPLGMRYLIRQGRNDMPPFRELSQVEIDEVRDYVLTLVEEPIIVLPK